MRQPTPTAFYGLSASDKITGAATPPASVALLQQADYWPMAVAFSPYAGCGHLFETGTSGTPPTRFLSVPVAPGGIRAKYATGNVVNNTYAAAVNIQASTTYGGDTGADIGTIVIQIDRVHVFDPVDIYNQILVESGDYDNASPGTAVNRMLQLEPLRVPKLEPFTCRNVSSFTAFVSRQASDLETLSP
jgi:hypothetical protein